MDEKIKRNLKVIDKPLELEDSAAEKKNELEKKAFDAKTTNPIYKNLSKFVNAKIGDKWSIKDLLR